MNIPKSFLCFFALITLSNVANGAISGRYVGQLHHDKINKDQLAKLDLFTSREADGKLQFTAILTLHFGGFESSEYLSYRFDDVYYNPINGQLVFDQSVRDLTIKASQFAPPFETISATVRSAALGSEVGTLSLKKDGTATPTAPLIQPLWGEYKSKCDGIATYIQIKTYRSSNETISVGNPFAAYDVTALKAEPDPAMELICKTIPPRPCVKRNYRSGTYHFFKDSLQLYGGSSAPLQCKVLANGLECNQCKYERISGEMVSPSLTPPASQDTFGPPDLTSPTGVEGSYRGFIFHEYLGKYQAANLNLVTFSSSEGTLSLSAVATLFFGTHDSYETISYKFGKKSYPLTKPIQILLSMPEKDAVLQVTSIGKDSISGTWFSSLFGRVGTFRFNRVGLPILPANAKLMEPVNGKYIWSMQSGGKWLDFDVVVPVVEGIIKDATFNPFQPLVFDAYYYNKDILPKTSISGGSYDFYTGHISIGNLFVGERQSRGEVYASPTTANVGVPLWSHKPDKLRFEGPVEE